MKHIGIIGLGLIGGSLAKLLKKRGELLIHALSLHEEDLILAKNENVIDSYSMTIDESFEKCDIIFICTPIKTITNLIFQLENKIKETCIVTDVGSVKAYVEENISPHFLSKFYIGGHPMAGDTTSSFKNSNETMLKGATYVLIKNENTNELKFKRFFSFLEGLGFNVIVTDAKTHDLATACISHLPHILSCHLANLAFENEKDTLFKELSSTGFASMTRLATSSPNIWENIFSTNKNAIIYFLEEYIKKLNSSLNTLKNDDFSEIYETFLKSNESMKHFKK